VILWWCAKVAGVWRASGFETANAAGGEPSTFARYKVPAVSEEPFTLPFNQISIMFYGSLTKAVGSAASALRSPRARPDRVLQQVRPIVTKAVFEVLKSGPWAQVISSSFRIQRRGDCIPNSFGMQRSMLDGLSAKDMVAVKPAPADRLRQLMKDWGCARDNPYELALLNDPTPQDVLQAVEHGPCVLTLARAIHPGQGDEEYRMHAIVVAGTFKVQHRVVAVVVDGNDLQKSELMQAVQQHADLHYGGDCNRLGAQDYEYIEKTYSSMGGLPYRLVDLDQMINASRERLKDHYQSGVTLRLPDSICWADNATVTQPLLTDEMKRTLAQVCGESGQPGLIE